MYLPPVLGSAKDIPENFEKLIDWTQVLYEFRRVVRKRPSLPFQTSTFTNPISSLLHQIASGRTQEQYVGLEQNFLLAAIHVAAMHDVTFPDGTLPDLPDDLPGLSPIDIESDDGSQDFVETSANANAHPGLGSQAMKMASVSQRTPLQLSLLISPLYLLLPKKLSVRSPNRRAVISVAGKLGLHRPDSLVQVEHVVWDALLKLSEGRTHVGVVLRELMDRLPWEIIDVVTNSDERYYFDLSHGSHSTALNSVQTPSETDLQIVSASVPQSASQNFPSKTDIPHLNSISSLYTAGTTWNFSPAFFPSDAQSLLDTLRSLGSDVMQSPAVRAFIESPRFHLAIEHTSTSPVFSRQKETPSTLLPSPCSDGDGSSVRPSSDVDGMADPTHRSSSDISLDGPDQGILDGLDLMDVDRSMFEGLLTLPPDDGCLAGAGTGDQSVEPALLTNNSSDQHILGDAVAGALPYPFALSDTLMISSLPRLGVDGVSVSDLENIPPHSVPTSGINVLSSATAPASSINLNLSGRPKRLATQSTTVDPALLTESATRNRSASRGLGSSIKKKRSSTNKVVAARVGPKRSKPSTRMKKIATVDIVNYSLELDELVSLFEPLSLKQFVKLEEIDEEANESPLRLPAADSFWAYDADGNKVTFKPAFHFPVYHDRVRAFFERIEMNLPSGITARHLHPDLCDSVVDIIPYQSWAALSSTQQQTRMSAKNIVVTGWPYNNSVQFNEDGIRSVVGPVSRHVSINGKMLCLIIVRSGHLQELLDNKGQHGKILNALDLPMWKGYDRFTPHDTILKYATDLHAWDVTCGDHGLDHSALYPTGETRWILVGHKDTVTFLHVDCEGFCTDVQIITGGKIWGFLRPRNSNPITSINFFLTEGFRLNEVEDSSEYDFEAIALRPGDKLFMKACQPHFVFGYDDTICFGGHYYMTSQMQTSLEGLIHSFILHKFLTNTSHQSSRTLYRRIVIFYSMAFIEGKVPSKDPSFCHLPVLNTIDGVLNLLAACVVVIFGNVLDFRTYCAPSQVDDTRADDFQHELLSDHDINGIPLSERFAICYARGIALCLMHWVRSFATIKDRDGCVVEDLPTEYVLRIGRALVAYKQGADIADLDKKANCTLPLLTSQIKNILESFEVFRDAWDGAFVPAVEDLRVPGSSDYTVQWSSNSFGSWKDKNFDFLLDGVTKLDMRYFASQKHRREFESSSLLPALRDVTNLIGERQSKRPRTSIS